MTPRSWTGAAALAAMTLALAACAMAPPGARAIAAGTTDDHGVESARADRAKTAVTRGLYANDGTAPPALAIAYPFSDAQADLDVVAPDAGRESAAAARLMVRTAEMKVEVPRPQEAVAACERLTDEQGGYVSSRDGTSLICRVPAPRFDEFVAAVATMGRVLSESMQALDVTDQHRDLQIRLDNAKTARDRLLDLLEKAEKVEDLLKIENELRRLTDEIEQMTAELENLESRVALSIVRVTFEGSAKPERDRTPTRRPSRFWWINVVGAEHVLSRF